MPLSSSGPYDRRSRRGNAGTARLQQRNANEGAERKQGKKTTQMATSGAEQPGTAAPAAAARRCITATLPKDVRPRRTPLIKWHDKAPRCHPAVLPTPRRTSEGTGMKAGEWSGGSPPRACSEQGLASRGIPCRRVSNVPRGEHDGANRTPRRSFARRVAPYDAARYRASAASSIGLVPFQRPGPGRLLEGKAGRRREPVGCLRVHHHMLTRGITIGTRS